MKTKNVDMLNGSISKGILMMILPLMAQNVLQTLFNVLDMTILSKSASDTAVGAVGACGTLITLCTSLLTGCTIGANVIVARHIGERDRNKTNDAINTAVAFALAGGFLLLVIGICCARIFLQWTNCSETLMADAVKYFRIYFMGVPILLLYSSFASILRAGGDTKRPMYFSITGGIVKVLLNYIFVYLFNFSVAGVAFATIISNSVSCILSYLALTHSHNHFDFKLRNMKIKLDELRQILSVGIPSGLQTGLYSFANVIILTEVNKLGADATTGLSIADQFDGILYQIIHAPGIAAISYVAQNIGARKYERVKGSIVSACWISVIFGATLGSLSAIFSKELSSIISSSPKVIAFAQQKMIIISSTYFICGINEVMGSALKGMGKAITPTVATLVFMCLFRFVWVYAIYPFLPKNLTFLYLVWPVGWILSIITLLVAFVPAIKKLKKQVECVN